MNVLIVEDEENLARQLKKMLLELDSGVRVLDILPSVAGSVVFLKSKTDTIDLILADIYLNDGLSFEIFEAVPSETPIVFCTAYDQYAIKAFELNSVDYLLKPIRKEQLEKALSKYKKRFASPHGETGGLSQKIAELSDQLRRPAKGYRKSFLLNHKGRLVPVSVQEISYFMADEGLIKCVTFEGKTYLLEQSLDALSLELDPARFYRANRQFLVSRKSVQDAEYYFNNRLSLNILPKPSEAIIISKPKVTECKNWLSEVGLFEIKNSCNCVSSRRSCSSLRPMRRWASFCRKCGPRLTGAGNSRSVPL